MKADRLFKRKGKEKGKIVWVAIARHLAVLTWILLTRKTVYQDKNFCKKQYKRKNRILQKINIEEILGELQRRNYSITC